MNYKCFEIGSYPHHITRKIIPSGVDVEVGCNRGKDGTIQLYEIRACFLPVAPAKVPIQIRERIMI